MNNLTSLVSMKITLRNLCFWLLCVHCTVFGYGQGEAKIHLEFNAAYGLPLGDASAIDANGQATDLFAQFDGGIGFDVAATYNLSRHIGVGAGLQVINYSAEAINCKVQHTQISAFGKYYITPVTNKLAVYGVVGIHFNVYGFDQQAYSLPVDNTGDPSDPQIITPTTIGRLAFNFSSELLPGATAGFGLNFNLSEKIGIRLQGTYQRTFVGSSQKLADFYPNNVNDFVGVVGHVGIYFKLIRSRDLF
jgi:hypothetical protein